MSTGNRDSIISLFLTNLAKAGVDSAGKVVGTAVGGVTGGPLGAVFGALGGAIIDKLIARYRDQPDVGNKLTAILARNAANDIDQLKKLLIKAAGMVDERTEIERLADAVSNSELAPNEPLLREAVERLFNQHGKTTDNPEELGKAIQWNQNIFNQVHAEHGGLAAGTIQNFGEMNIVVNAQGESVDATNDKAPQSSLRTSTSKLPTIGEHFLGRDERMADLDAAWADGTLNVLSLVADGGVGKTSLIVHWLTRFAQDGFRGAERVFAWSFYSQGISDQTATAELFINDALEWFGDPNPAEGSPYSRGQRLANLIQKHRTLMIIDGLEPMQHPEEQLDGRLREQSLQALVKELAGHNPGLLLITTRINVADLNPFQGTTANRIDLEMLSPESCVKFFETFGVVGSTVEIKEAAEHFNHHALSIQLIGKFIANRYDDRDIRHWKEVSLLTADKWDRHHATKVMQSYEKWFVEEDRRSELGYLRIIGLFNRPASKEEIDAILTGQAIDGLTDALTGLTETDRMLALNHLREAGLLLPKDKNSPSTIDAHPLVREHFGERLREENKIAWKAGHSRLFDYLTGSGCEKELPDTLEEMTPLFAAIPHGCKGGRQLEALNDVFYRRIRRDSENFSLNKLGAFGLDLATMANFFDDHWAQVGVYIVKKYHTKLLNDAGACLRASGRFGESEVPLRTGLENSRLLAMTDDKNRNYHLHEVSTCASNLGQLLLELGRFTEAIDFALESVKFADQSDNVFGPIIARSALAIMFHQAGQVDAARRLFEQTEELLKKIQGVSPLLGGIGGYGYCDLLLDEAKFTTDSGEIRRCIAKVLWRVSIMLDASNQHGFLVSPSFCHLALGRAMLLELQYGGEGSFAKSAAQTETAVDKLRGAGQINFLPHGLLFRAALFRIAVEHSDTSSIPDAERDLDEVIDISTRDEANGGTLKLFLCDAHLEYARLRLAQNQTGEARKHFDVASALVDECGYHRRDDEVAELRDRLNASAAPAGK